ncbi:MAG: transporter substrate-binding domain-containing protein [Natronospirillum sp.]
MSLCKTKSTRVLCLLAALLTLPLNLTADTAANRSSELPLFAIADVWPWGYSDDGKPSGLLVTLTDRLLAEAALDARVELRPHLRAINGIADGTADFAYLFADPTLNPDAISLAIIIESFTLLTVLASPSRDAPELKDFVGRRVGYIRGTYYGEAFAELDAIKIPAEDGAQALQLLQRGRVDAIITTDQAVYNAADLLGIARSQLSSTVLIRSQVGHLYLSHLSPYGHLAEPLRHALNHLREDGFLQQLFNLPQP